MSKAAYRSGCRDKHNRTRSDSNLRPPTSQSGALTTGPLRPGKLFVNDQSTRKGLQYMTASHFRCAALISSGV